MKLTDTIMLAAAANGIPPEIVKIAEEFGNDLSDLIRTSIERNVVETLRAKVQIATALRAVPEYAEQGKDLLRAIEGEMMNAFGMDVEGEDDDAPEPARA